MPSSVMQFFLFFQKSSRKPPPTSYPKLKISAANIGNRPNCMRAGAFQSPLPYPCGLRRPCPKAAGLSNPKVNLLLVVLGIFCRFLCRLVLTLGSLTIINASHQYISPLSSWIHVIRVSDYHLMHGYCLDSFHISPSLYVPQMHGVLHLYSWV